MIKICVFTGTRAEYGIMSRLFRLIEKNPYEKENTLQEIFNTIKTYPLENLIKKHFYDIKQ